MYVPDIQYVQLLYSLLYYIFRKMDLKPDEIQQLLLLSQDKQTP